MHGESTMTIGETKHDANVDPLLVEEAFHSLREGIQVLSADWRYLYVNEAVAQHGRKTREELLGRTLLECYPGIEQTAVFAVMDRCMRQRSSESVENEFTYEDGQRAWFELRIQPFRAGLFVLSLDITERKKVEEDLRASRVALERAERLRALGQMAAGISHDLRNLLNPLSLHLQIACRASARSESAKLEQALEAMKLCIKRGVEVTERLRDFGRQTPASGAVSIDLNALAHEAVELAKARLATTTYPGRIHEDFGSPAPALGHPADVVSAVLNLLVNAIDAAPGGANITARTGDDHGRGWIAVSDDGPGMSSEVEKRVFEPFFTTKGTEGTGLGLATVYATMHRAGGSVHLETAPGKGTTFTLSFPRASPGGAAPA